MSANRWELNYAWVSGQGYRESGLLELEGSFDLPDLADKVLDRLIQLGEAKLAPTHAQVSTGGALARLEHGRIIVSSAGEDGCDSIKYLADLIAGAAEEIEPNAKITWLERAPRSQTGAASLWLDGYWIPADAAATYLDRRGEALRKLLAANADFVDDFQLQNLNGRKVALFSKNGQPVTELGLGVGVLELIEEAEAESTLNRFFD